MMVTLRVGRGSAFAQSCTMPASYLRRSPATCDSDPPSPPNVAMPSPS